MRKQLFTILFCVALPATAAWAEGGAASIPEDPPSPTAVAPDAMLGEALAGLSQAFVRKDAQGARAAGEGVIEAARSLGQDESEPLAAAVLQLAQPAPAPLRLFGAELAVRLAPSMPRSHLALAAASFRSHPFAVGTWGKGLWQGAEATFSSQRHRAALLLDAWAALLLSLQIAAPIAWGAAALRHGRGIAHDWAHWLPGRPPAWLAATCLLAAVAVAATWIEGWALLFVVAVAPLWLHASRQERGIFAALIAAAALAPLATGWVGAATAWAGTEASLLDAVDRRGDLSRLDELRAWGQERDAPAEAIFALARAEARLGAADQAHAQYVRALALRPGWPSALVNLGNLEFLAGDRAQAEKRYEQAVQADPLLAAGWFGLSRVHYRRVEIGLGQEARDRALALDPSLVERYALGEDEAFRTKRYLVDASLGDADLAPLTLGKGRAVPGELRWWAPIPAAASPWVGGGAALGLLLLPLALQGGRSRSCERCGAPVCPRCDRRAAGAGSTCGPCLQVQSKEAVLDPAFRVEKELQQGRYRRRRAAALRWSGPLLLGPWLRGRAAVGWILVAGVSFVMALALGPGHATLAGGWPVALRIAAVAATSLAAVAISILSSREES